MRILEILQCSRSNANSFMMRSIGNMAAVKTKIIVVRVIIMCLK